MDKWEIYRSCQSCPSCHEVPRCRSTRRSPVRYYPELMNLGSTHHTLNGTTKDVDQRTGKIALEAETSGTDDRLVPPRYLAVDNDKK